MTWIEIFVFMGFAFLLWVFNDRKKCKGFPPGPVRLPVIGNLLHIIWEFKHPAAAFQNLAKKYGDDKKDLVFLRLGQRDAIVFNSSESIKYIFGNEHCQDRVQDIVQLVKEYLNGDNLGLAFGNGFEWQTLRHFTIKTLRKYGFGKSAEINAVINEEVDTLVDLLKTEMKKHPEGVSNLPKVFSLSTLNVIWKFLMGREYHLTDERVGEIEEISSDLFKSSYFCLNLSFFFPFFAWIPMSWFHERVNKRRTFLKSILAQFENGNGDKSTPKCYLEEFLCKIEERKEEKGVFTATQLVTSFADLLDAGRDPTSSALVFSILYLIAYPKVQKRVQNEIEENLEKDEVITISTKAKLPYTFATVLESQRYSTVTPISIPRVARQDLHYQGYYIKKGTILIPNLYSASFDVHTWGDPLNFRPERFLNTEGNMDGGVTAKMMQFGFGPRYCIGSAIAESMLFVYLATILREFNLESFSSEGLSLEPQLGLTYSPKPFKAKFISRK